MLSLVAFACHRVSRAQARVDPHTPPWQALLEQGLGDDLARRSHDLRQVDSWFTGLARAQRSDLACFLLSALRGLGVGIDTAHYNAAISGCGKGRNGPRRERLNRPAANNDRPHFKAVRGGFASGVRTLGSGSRQHMGPHLLQQPRPLGLKDPAEIPAQQKFKETLRQLDEVHFGHAPPPRLRH